jgi:hypothetical protein
MFEIGRKNITPTFSYSAELTNTVRASNRMGSGLIYSFLKIEINQLE